MQITNVAIARTWFFYCGSWLDSKHGLEKLLTASLTDPRANLLTYTIIAHTSDIKGAGTDASVFVELFGSKSSSGTKELNGPGNLFEQGKSNTFQIKTVELGDLSELEVS